MPNQAAPLQQHCHACGQVLSVQPRYGYPPLIRCLTPSCAQTNFKPIPREATTWVSRNWI